MEHNGKHYYKIDVGGRNGYSFMVRTNDYIDEYDVIDMCLSRGIFSCDTDAEYAVVDDMVSEYDIENFKSCTHDID